MSNLTNFAFDLFSVARDPIGMSLLFDGGDVYPNKTISTHRCATVVQLISTLAKGVIIIMNSDDFLRFRYSGFRG